MTDEELRIEAGRALHPGPCKHDARWRPGRPGAWRCKKCRRKLPKPEAKGRYLQWATDCDVPDPDSRPWAVIADELVRKCHAANLIGPIIVTMKMNRWTGNDAWFWFATQADARTRVEICLEALR